MTIRNLIVSVLLMSGLFAQAIHGVIHDTDSKPLEGANVVVVGTTYGAVSDENGIAHIDIQQEHMMLKLLLLAIHQ